MTARVAGPTSTAPGLAADCNAAATLTTSPNAPYSTLAPPPIGPTTAGPDSTPIRSKVPPSVTVAAKPPAARGTPTGRPVPDHPRATGARRTSPAGRAPRPRSRFRRAPPPRLSPPPRTSDEFPQRLQADRAGQPGRGGDLGEQHADGPPFLPRKRLVRRRADGGRGARGARGGRRNRGDEAADVGGKPELADEAGCGLSRGGVAPAGPGSRIGR